jgi:serine/threonine protein kinase
MENKVEKKIFIDKIKKFIIVETKLMSKALNTILKIENMEDIEDSGSETFSTIHSINRVVNKVIYHINSGGFGSIYKLSTDYCIRIHLNNPYDHEWSIPKDIETILIKNKMEHILEFLNIPICIFKNYFLYGIYQYYIVNCAIICCTNYLLNQKERDWNKDIKTIVNTTQIEPIKNLYKIFKDKKTQHKAFKIYTDITFQAFEGSKYPVVIANKFENFASLLVDLLKNTAIENTDIEIILKFFNSSQINKILLLEAQNNDKEADRLKNEMKENILKIKKEFIPFFGNISIQHLALGNFFTVRLDNFGRINHRLENSLAMKNQTYVKLCILQVLLSLIIMNKKTGFVHNDLKPDNILVYSKNKDISIEYKEDGLNGCSFDFFESYIFKLNDFDFSRTNNVSNQLNSQNNLNDIFYDVHFLFVTLFSNRRYIEEMEPIYEEYYKILIEGKCYVCDTFYRKKDKSISRHEVSTIISLNEIGKFLKTSSLFSLWRRG